MGKRKKEKQPPLNLPEEERIRMTREELAGASMLIACYVYLKHATEQLRRQVGKVPYGMARMKMIIGNLEGMKENVLGTVPDKQLKRLDNMGMDMEIRLVPKLMPTEKSLVMSKEQAMELVDAAMEKCKECTETYDSSLKCGLRSLLEAMIPLDNYSALSCPYTRTEWEENRQK